MHYAGALFFTTAQHIKLIIFIVPDHNHQHNQYHSLYSSAEATTRAVTRVELIKDKDMPPVPLSLFAQPFDGDSADVSAVKAVASPILGSRPRPGLKYSMIVPLIYLLNLQSLLAKIQ